MSDDDRKLPFATVLDDLKFAEDHGWTAVGVPLVNLRELVDELEALRKVREAARHYQAALYACRRAMHSTRGSLTPTAIREAHLYLSAVLKDDEAAAEWFESAMALPDSSVEMDARALDACPTEEASKDG